MISKSEQSIAIIGGTFASGKETYCRHLATDYGFKHVSYGDVLRAEASRQGLDNGRATLLNISESIRRSRGLTGMAQLVLEHWDKEKQLCPGGLVVDGPRAIGDAEGLKIAGGRLFFVDAPVELRYQRMLERGRDSEVRLSFDEFVAGEQREWEGDGTPYGPNLKAIKEMAELVIENTGTKDELFHNLDGALGLGH